MHATKITNTTATIAAFLAFSVAASGAIYTTTLSGVTTNNTGGAAPNFNAQFPVGSAWSATLQWDTEASPLFSGATQAQFRLLEFELTLYGETENFTTSALTDKASFGVTNGSITGGDYHSIQFTTEYGTENLTDDTIYEYTLLSLNITLEPVYFNGAASLTTPPSELDLSLYDLENSQTGLKIYTTDMGWSNTPLRGNINPVPEPSTYALMGGVAMLGLAALRRRKAK
ncbi:PEP-CTERM sorting domain-containing protein [Ruficoccus amylovorans]|uniref:PEP-CTERM sorting domain-containing protein n=1 Tax=Ruficoccus amylovorans TaxID=1804625 RepID=A0A842HI73_9BACT|nr:PEP-CTERM sorting domain-containing protein [Ruficoccus amylovorans]MBC2595286.1 PEP-CTERM sorting domain-containing protein [Ruficoccus amylovorans]